MVLKWMAKPWLKRSAFTFFQVRCHLGLVDGRALEIGGCEKDYIGLLHRFADIQHLKTVFLSDRDRFTAFVQTDHDLYAAVFEIERVRMSLGSESDYRTHFPIEVREVGVFIRVDFCCHNLI